MVELMYWGTGVHFQEERTGEIDIMVVLQSLHLNTNSFCTQKEGYAAKISTHVY